MKLKKLIIQGFKSFKDRTIVNFDAGVTGIVGPNGSGKSNIVDALFWVMGEQSAKHLRGDVMKDIIFSGSSKYSPAAFAEVSLVLENEEGKHIHIGQSIVAPLEIQITRKLYRNGETEYRINDTPCRLKDIQEVFMDTGAGAKSYSIVAQGEIARLVQAKPQERRSMIEEVAGVVKFKMRRKESLKKIEQAKQNLSRLLDLKTEIEKNLSTLRSQSEKALRARVLKEKLEKLELIVFSHKEFEYLRTYKEIQSELKLLKTDIETKALKKTNLELSLASERNAKDVLSNESDLLLESLNETKRLLTEKETEQKFRLEAQKEKERLLSDLSKEKQDLEHTILERSKRLEILKEELEKLKATESADYSELIEHVASLQEALKEDEKILNEREEKFKGQQDELFRLTQENENLELKLVEYASNIEDMTKEIDALERQYASVSLEILNLRETTLHLEKETVKLIEEEGDKRLNLENAEKEFHSFEDRLLDIRKALAQTETTLSTLKEIDLKLEGQSEGAKELALLGLALFGDKIECNDEYAKLSETVFFDLLDTLTGDSSIAFSYRDKEDAFSFRFLSSSNSELSTDSSSSEVIERLQLLGFTGVKPLSEIIRFKDFNLTTLLNGIFLVDHIDLSLFERLSLDINFNAIVSLDSKTLIRKTFGLKELVVLSERNNSEGIIERKKRILSLEEELKKNQESLGLIEGQLLSAKELYYNHKDQYENHKNRRVETEARFEAQKSSLDAKSMGVSSGEKRLEILKNRKNETSSLRLSLLEKHEDLKKRLNLLKETPKDTQEDLLILKTKVLLSREEYQKNKEDLLEKQIEAKTLSQRLESLTSQLEDIEIQLAKYKEKLVSNADLDKNYRNDIISLNESLEALKAQVFSIAENVKDKERAYNEHHDRLSALLLNMNSREEEVRKLSKEIAGLEKKTVDYEIKTGLMQSEEEQLTKNIFEKYRVDLREILSIYLSLESLDLEGLHDISDVFFTVLDEKQVPIEKKSYEFIRRFGQDLKDSELKFKEYKAEFSNLGTINWQAIEDYDKQKLRFDFLNEQERELKVSLHDLEEAILHIDQKSKERFALAFEEVNTRFQRVFPLIFGGGEARLDLVKDELDPEAEDGIEIIARPPGKRMQNVNLMSGGEKALTAVSLIFSIFLVKPSPFCLLDEVDAPLDDANVGRFNELIREMSTDSQFILITHNKNTMEQNDVLYGVTMEEPGVSKTVWVELQ